MDQNSRDKTAGRARRREPGRSAAGARAVDASTAGTRAAGRSATATGTTATRAPATRGAGTKAGGSRVAGADAAGADAATRADTGVGNPGAPRAGATRAKGRTARAAHASAVPGRETPARRGVAAVVADAASGWTPQIRSVADQLLGWAGTAAELSLGVGKALARKPAQKKALERAGALLREAREQAGLTLGEVSAAIDVKDPALLDLAEHGKAALPFELLLRLAAVLARNDPIPFALSLTRSYSPQLWRTLEQLGVARLALHAGREHEFINIYRSRDAARTLSDAQFARVLHFTDAAFELAMSMTQPAAEETAGKSAGRPSEA